MFLDSLGLVNLGGGSNVVSVVVSVVSGVEKSGVVAVESVVVGGGVSGVGVGVSIAEGGDGSGGDGSGGVDSGDLGNLRGHRKGNLSLLGGLESLGKVSLGQGDVLRVVQVGVGDCGGSKAGVLALLGLIESGLEGSLGGLDLSGVLEREGGGGGHESGNDLEKNFIFFNNLSTAFLHCQHTER